MVISQAVKYFLDLAYNQGRQEFKQKEKTLYS